MVPRHRRHSESYSGRGVFNSNVLDENLRFAQRSLEGIITEILEDDKMLKDKKVDALTKYYSVLIKKKIVNEIEIIQQCRYD